MALKLLRRGAMCVVFAALAWAVMAIGASSEHSSWAAATQSAEPALPPPPEEIRLVQEALKRDGFQIRRVDGVLGDDTREALRDFQKREGMLVTGTLDAATLAALGIISDIDDVG